MSKEHIEDAEVIQEKVTYDPSKQYAWEKETEFTFKGVDFSILYNNISGFMGDDSINPRGILKLADAFAVIQKLLVQKVESGEIKEAPKE